MSFEEYAHNYYMDKLREAEQIVDNTGFALDPALIAAVFSKIARDEYYLRQEYEPSRPEQSGPQKAPPQIPPAKPAVSPHGDADASEASFRKPVQTIILPDEYENLVDIREDAVYLKEYIKSKRDWEGINQILRQYGYRWISAGKDSKWKREAD